MSAEQELFRAYAEWRRLAEAEASAIQSQNWTLLADCQQAIVDYQKHVSRLTLEAREEWRGRNASLEFKQEKIQSLVAELVELTRKNHSLLAAARHKAKTRIAELREAGVNLKRMRSYAQGAMTASAV